MALELLAATLAHGGQAPVLDEISLVFSQGWTGVAGPNGAGKSTLLAALAGELPLRAGRLRQRLPGPVIRCPQDPAASASAARAWARSDAGADRRLRAALALDPAALDRWSTLSPGEQRRWQIGAALAAEPAALLLDEPTAHLDAVAAARLALALRAFAGVGVVVSHDRAFLDALVTRVVWVEAGRAEVRAGGWTAASAAMAAQAEDRRAALTAQQGEARALKARLGAERAQAEAAGRGRRTGRADPRDHDARSMGRKVVTGWAEDRLARKARNTRAAWERAEAALADHGVRRASTARLAVDFAAPSGGLAAEVRATTLGPAGEPGATPALLNAVRVQLEVGARVWIAGANGAGKSTLLAALHGGLRVSPSAALYLPQRRPPAQDRAALAAVKALPPQARGEALARLAALGHEPGRVLATEQPSPGQGQGLALALALGGAAAVALLDEPTHDLDLPAVGRLEAALAAWPGTLALVTHDRALAARLCTRAWWVADGRVEVLSVAEAAAQVSAAAEAAMVQRGEPRRGGDG